VGYLNCLGSHITDDTKFTCEIRSRITIPTATFNNKKALFTSTLDLNLRKRPVQLYIWSIALYRAETRTLWKLDQIYLYCFKIWC